MEIATFGNIPILSQYCGIGCVFCKVHTDSYLGHYPKIPPIDREDLLKGFEYTNPNVNYVRLGADTEHGMAVCIGRLREDTLFDYKFACMSHNTLRGAAGGAVLLAELLAAKGYFD